MRRHVNVPIFVPHLGCPHACAFCDQRSITGQSAVPDAESVAGTLKSARASLGERVRDAQIAFFGGSFTAIDACLRRRLLEAVQPFLGTDGFSGIRISTRPDAVDADVLDELRGFGVVAIELGAQSMSDRVLELCGRGHGSGDVIMAARRVREHGFSLGLQMMTGLPGDTPDGAIDTAVKLAGLQPDTMRIYPAITLEGTRLAELYRTGGYMPDSLEDTVGLCARLLEYFVLRGIGVIRLGLQSGGGLEDRIVAGPWHPALRELCEGRLLLDRAFDEIGRRGILPGARITLLVHPGEQGKMAGHNRRNLNALEEAGYRATIHADASVESLGLRVTDK